MPDADKTIQIKTGSVRTDGAQPPPPPEAPKLDSKAAETRGGLLDYVTPLTTRIFSKRKDVDSLISATHDSDPGMAKDVDLAGTVGGKLPDVDERYERLEAFAEGGHGSVALAMDKNLQRLVALKSLRSEYIYDNSIVKSFVAEAKVTAQLEHPSIVPIYSIDSDNGDGLHLAMKLVRGKTLKDYLNQIIINYNREGIHSFDERKSLAYRLDIFLRICDAISYAHSRNVMHCDLKPENVMIGEYRETYVMDWGIARLIDEPGFDPSKWVRPKSISGTPRYLSPEAIEGEHTDRKADIFALGLILFEMTTLRNAVSGSDTAEVMNKIRYGELEPLRHKFGAHIDADLKAIIRKAAEIDKARRYQTVEELAEDVRRFLRFAEVSARPDNLAMKTLRALYNHRLAFAGAILTALLIGAAGISFALYERMGSLERSRAREGAISLAHGRTAYAAYTIDRLTLHLENLLDSIASETSFLLRWGHAADPGPLYMHSDLEKASSAPPDLSYSPVYKRKISLDYFVYKLPPGRGIEEFKEELEGLSPMRTRFLWALLESSPDAKPPQLAELPEMKMEVLEKGMPMRWLYIGLADGFFISYPGKDGYPESYDPRLRPWYKEGSASFAAKWASPYIDIGGQGIVLPCTTPIFDEKGGLIGVAGLDMSFDFIVSKLGSMGNAEACVIEKLLVDEDGRVVVSTRSPLAGLTFTPGEMRNDVPKLPKFKDADLLKRMQTEKYGSILNSEGGTETLYSFATVRTLSWLYIEKLDFDKLLASSRHEAPKHP